MRKIFFLLLVFFSFVMIATLLTPLAIATETERKNIQEEHAIELKIQDLSEEWQRHLVESVNRFLEKELSRLRKNRAEPKESLDGQIEKYEEEIQGGSNDPDTFLSLARINDQMEDGANAIINAKKAEKIFVERNNVKGAAEVRRSLRHYYEKYNYLPEDFELTQ